MSRRSFATEGTWCARAAASHCCGLCTDGGGCDFGFGDGSGDCSDGGGGGGNEGCGRGVMTCGIGDSGSGGKIGTNVDKGAGGGICTWGAIRSGNEDETGRVLRLLSNSEEVIEGSGGGSGGGNGTPCNESCDGRKFVLRFASILESGSLVTNASADKLAAGNGEDGGTTAAEIFKIVSEWSASGFASLGGGVMRNRVSLLGMLPSARSSVFGQAFFSRVLVTRYTILSAVFIMGIDADVNRSLEYSRVQTHVKLRLFAQIRADLERDLR